ncbi:MAG: hypothetical protein SFX18_17245 [Pirellulales bacterium]|nr:hypothetical protein [Pirellulales bacterium]
MNYPLTRGLLLYGIGLGLLLAVTGCSFLAAGAYVLFPNDVKAHFPGLRGKKTAVVCRAASLEFAEPGVSRELAARIGMLMQKNDDRIMVIDPEKLADWTDRNDWTEFRQIGKALKADMVVGIELERFTISQGSTLLQGQADARIAVYDMKEGGKLVYELKPRTIKFPPNSPISSAERQEADFRNQFVDIVADTLARNFYDYDSRAYQATDSTALR